MHRGYRRAQYGRVCAALRDIDPDTEFTTDVMVAFPGESDADHGETLSLIEEAGMLAVHAFRYSPREDTPAAALAERVPDPTARRRSAEVRRAAAASGRARRLRAVGSRQHVVWDRVADGAAHGVGSTYLEVVAAAGGSARVGALDTVEVEAIDGDVLRGPRGARMNECLFCAIAAGEVPATFVHQDELVVAFRDINPQAPTHILVIPREHIASAADLTGGTRPGLGAAPARGATAGCRRGDRRNAATGIVTNVGGDGGQTVAHLHLHLLGGRPMSWPPG